MSTALPIHTTVTNSQPCRYLASLLVSYLQLTISPHNLYSLFLCPARCRWFPTMSSMAGLDLLFRGRSLLDLPLSITTSGTREMVLPAMDTTYPPAFYSRLLWSGAWQHVNVLNLSSLKRTTFEGLPFQVGAETIAGQHDTDSVTDLDIWGLYMIEDLLPEWTFDICHISLTDLFV